MALQRPVAHERRSADEHGELLPLRDRCSGKIGDLDALRLVRAARGRERVGCEGARERVEDEGFPWRPPRISRMSRGRALVRGRGWNRAALRSRVVGRDRDVACLVACRKPREILGRTRGRTPPSIEHVARARLAERRVGNPAEERSGLAAPRGRRIGGTLRAHRRGPGKASGVFGPRGVIAQAPRDLERHARHDARHHVAIRDHGEAVVHRDTAAFEDDGAVDEAVAIAPAPGGVVAVDEVGVVLAREADGGRVVEEVRGIAMRGALRRVGRAAAEEVAVARRAVAALLGAVASIGIHAREWRARRDDDGDGSALVRAIGLGDGAVVQERARTVAHADRPQGGVGRHVEARAAHRAVEQSLVLARDRIPQALAMSVAQVRQPQRLPWQASEALRLAAVARHRAARRFGPAVVVEVGTRQVARPDLGGDRPVDGVRDERLARLGERALGQAIALRGAARRGEGEGEREARDTEQDDRRHHEKRACLPRATIHAGLRALSRGP